MCVLLVEDEALIATVMAESLEDAGYEVIRTETAEGALAAFDEMPGRFTVLVTDIHLRGEVSGLDVAHEVRRANPRIPVIVTTGRADAIDPSWRDERGFVVLAKPFAPSTLIATVGQLVG